MSAYIFWNTFPNSQFATSAFLQGYMDVLWLFIPVVLFPNSVVTLTLLLHLFLHLLMKSSNIHKLDIRLCSFSVLVANILQSARIYILMSI